MTDDEREEIRELYQEWEESIAEEEEAASRAARAEDELSQRGINVNCPPDWVSE